MFKQKFNNEHGGGAVGLLVVLIFSLTFSSFAIAFLLTQIYGANVITGNMGGVPLPTSGEINAVQDYTNNSIDDSVNYVNGFGNYIFVPSVGRVLTSNPSGIDCLLLLKRVSPVNNTYTVSYAINNTIHGNYRIMARYYSGVLTIYNVIVEVKQDGFHVSNGLSETYFLPYLNANQIDYPNIKTVFNDNTQTLEVYLKGELLFSESNIWKPLLSGEVYWAGVSSKIVGFTVESINVGSFISSNPTDILGQVASIIDVISKIILWGMPEQYLPFILSVIFIRTQEAAIVICAIAVFIRGVG